MNQREPHDIAFATLDEAQLAESGRPMKLT